MIPGKEGNGRFFYLRDLTGKKIIRDEYYNLRPDEKTAILRRVGIKEIQVDFVTQEMMIILTTKNSSPYILQGRRDLYILDLIFGIT